MKNSILILFLALISTVISARTLTGTVYDQNSNPLPGVVIAIKGTSQSTIADLNGFFSIEIADDNAILVFSYAGYKVLEMNAGTSASLTVYMNEDLKKLEEIVVTGYGKPKRGHGPIVITTSVLAKADMDATGYYEYAQPEFNTEGYTAIHENGFKKPLEAPLSTFSIDVDAAAYSNLRRFINGGSIPPVDAIRIEEMINYFDYDYNQPSGEHPFYINYELGECPWNADHRILHIGLQGKKYNTQEVPASNIVFLIDVSGSMSDENKLPLLKNAFKLLVSQLREKDKVAIVVYAGSSGLVLPSTNGDQKEIILEALDRLEAGGSTAGAEGLKLAYEVAEKNFIKQGNNRIVLATDGDFNVGQSSNAEMERLVENYREKNIFISVAGFGMGNYKDDKMEIIADKGNGNYSYIDNLMEAKKVFINEFSSTLFTIAKDVKIQIEFNPTYVAEYRLIGYENRVLNNEDFDNDKKDAGELGAGHTVTALYEIVPAGMEKTTSRDLRYQQTNANQEFNNNNELAYIKFRYKKPDSDTSILMEETIMNQSKNIAQTSDNFKFSASVAGFGMLLRNSEFKGNLSYDQILDLARESKGEDTDGYRNEFIRLVELSRHL